MRIEDIKETLKKS